MNFVACGTYVVSTQYYAIKPHVFMQDSGYCASIWTMSCEICSYFWFHSTTCTWSCFKLPVNFVIVFGTQNQRVLWAWFYMQSCFEVVNCFKGRCNQFYFCTGCWALWMYAVGHFLVWFLLYFTCQSLPFRSVIYLGVIAFCFFLMGLTYAATGWWCATKVLSNEVFLFYTPWLKVSVVVARLTT